ncbi:MAG TPA: UDP-3-O-acyl-N-acetylglucosamine deacetylase [Alphaproteobacteria bacterium]|jgi:UDP-3-O-[3-hydroxymyristoyl] N-acetylglucosamine deacetylase
MGQIVRQKTLKSAIGCSGIGLHSGAKVSMTLLPADENSGIVFKRTDIPGGQAMIAADWRNVTDSQLCTAISMGGSTISTIEHLMAALAAAGIDNAVVELNGPEVPIMDGSAAPFVFLIECAGTVEQAAARRAVVVKKPVSVTVGDKRAAIEPGAGFSISFDIDFSSAAVRRQTFAFDLVDGAFKSDIARARTFGFEHEVSALRAQGLLRGGSIENAVVVSGDKVLNPTGLRYVDEFVRHKVLDSVGDLYLAGAPLIGHFHGSRSGHRMNHQLLQALFADKGAHEIVDLDTDLLHAEAENAMPMIAGAASRKSAAAAIR